jgi:1-acyl-sn-glycerol-3-phosphate acyltransferase
MVDSIVFALIRLLIKFDGLEELEKIPMKGPLVVASNHTSFLEIPLIYRLLHPRKVYGMGKAEIWKNPFFRIFTRSWPSIKVYRGKAARETFEQVRAALDEGSMIALAPEGTRSKTGILQKGKAGIAVMAAQNNAPILPLAHWGGEDFWKNLKRFRRTVFHVRVGPILYPQKQELVKSERQELSDGIMSTIAGLIPPEYHGYYANPEDFKTNLLSN